MSANKTQVGQRTAFERFEELLRRVIAVPKRELDRRVAIHQGKRRQNSSPRRTTKD